MAREGGVLADGNVLTSSGLDQSEADIHALILRQALLVNEHGITTYSTTGHNAIVSGFTEVLVTHAYAFVDGALTNKSAYDWKVLGNNYLAPPCTNIFDDFADSSIDGAKWDNTGSTAWTESAGWVQLSITGASSGRLTGKTNWGTGGSAITYLRFPVACTSSTTAPAGTTFSVQLSSVTGAGGTQVTLWTYVTSGSGPSFANAVVVDVWISGNSAYVYANGVYYGTSDITAIAATWYPRFYMASGTNDVSLMKVHNCSNTLGATSTIFLATKNSYLNKNIRNIILIGKAYNLFTGMAATTLIAPSMSDDNGTAYITKTYGDATDLATNDDGSPPFIFNFDGTDYRSKAKFIFTNDNTGTSYGYALLDFFGYVMRQ